MKGKVWAGVDASETFTQAPSAKKCCTMRMTFPPQQLHEPSTLPSPRGFWGSHGRACAPVQASGGGSDHDAVWCLVPCTPRQRN